ncbi:methyl-CpG-binding domain-containing protein 8 [Eutrema salsugineum]|nr:methyl-CpG-binding domain-containing protein 8 [Eutrema salsugineum]
MDGENLGNHQPNFEGGSGDRLSAESLPLIDTRLLSQSELRALSPSSSSSASLAASAGVDDDLTPKIDRSVFNESAGSRKQTFLRVRLARDPPPPRPPSPQRRRDDSSREEKSQVASLLRSLFSVDSFQRNAEEDEGEEEVEEKEGQPLISLPIHNNGNVYRNPYFDSVKNVQGISENETRRRPGRPRKIRNPSDGVLDSYADESEREGTLSVDKTRSNLGTESGYDASGISMDSNPGKRKRGRPRKSGDGCKSEDKEEIVSLENREGTMVDLSALANNEEDPYGEELRRITVGLGTKEELLAFLEQVNGEWVNAGKKKKVVKACDYGGYLPRGWKLMLCIKKKGSIQWLACRRYISPDGQEFATCKEVSTYLQSLVESQSKNRLNSFQSDNHTLGEPVMGNESLVGNSDSMDLPVSNPETNQNRGSERTSSEVLGEAKGGENGDIIDPVKTSLVEEDGKMIPRAEFLNGDNEDDMKKRDDNMENLAALLN